MQLGWPRTPRAQTLGPETLAQLETLPFVHQPVRSELADAGWINLAGRELMFADFVDRCGKPQMQNRRQNQEDLGAISYLLTKLICDLHSLSIVWGREYRPFWTCLSASANIKASADNIMIAC